MNGRRDGIDGGRRRGACKGACLLLGHERIGHGRLDEHATAHPSQNSLRFTALEWALACSTDLSSCFSFAKAPYSSATSRPSLQASFDIVHS